MNGRLHLKSKLTELGDLEDTDISTLVAMLDNFEVSETVAYTQILPYILIGVVVTTTFGLFYMPTETSRTSYTSFATSFSSA